MVRDTIHNPYVKIIYNVCGRKSGNNRIDVCYLGRLSVYGRDFKQNVYYKLSS